jgi:hypothetical protein
MRTPTDKPEAEQPSTKPAKATNSESSAHLQEMAHADTAAVLKEL